MRVTQQLIDEQHAHNRCDGCGGTTLPDGAIWDGEWQRRIELCASCTVRVGGSLIADSLPSTEPADVVRALGSLTQRVWQCARGRTVRERMTAGSTTHGS